MISLNYRDSRPIYEQIKDGLRKLIVTGALRTDDKLPSVRALAQQLSINPNTIQRAYNELEGEGYIYSVPGKGSFAAAVAGADTERKRELATIRVLGFYDREVSAYVNRENVVLTAVGIVLGCVLGHFLHVWLVKSVEIDMMMFGRDTAPSAYVWAAVLTALFSAAVSLLAHRKMKGIDMVESLKSAE